MKKSLTEESQGPKKETEKRKTDIPKEFIKKIKNLGMKVEDAEVLYKSKIDWCAVYSENLIYCTEPGCDFSTSIDNEDLINHMINVHIRRISIHIRRISMHNTENIHVITIIVTMSLFQR